MKRWDDYTEDERTEMVRGFTGEIRECRWQEPGTMMMLDVGQLNVPLSAFYTAPRAPRKVLFLAPDVWAAWMLLWKPAPSLSFH